jgi:hypothetical protein
MTAKEALLMLKLGAVICRPSWNGQAVVTLDSNGVVFARFSDGTIIRDSVESFLWQKWTDWEVYCPQDNK